MRNMMMKVFILGLMFFIGKVMVFGQDTDVKCEVSVFDYNLSGSKVYGELGSFSLFADGKKEEDGVVVVTKFYKLPRTNLILSVLVFYVPKDEVLGNQLIMQQLVLGKKRVPISLNFDKEKMTEDLASVVFTGYPIEAFDRGGGGNLSTAFLGKKKPVAIMMKCKRVKKEDK